MTDQQHVITTPDGEEFEIPVEGSLGLLALGDLGLIGWRAKIEQVKRDMAARSQAAAASESATESRDTDEANG